MTHGYFSMLADGKTLRDDVRAYYSEMVEKINREWWDKARLLKEPLREDGVYEIVIQRDGTIMAQQLVRSTGSREADQLIAEIIKKASPLPPLPATYQLDQFQVPLKIKAPLSLFRVRN
jgi:protein TonB